MARVAGRYANRIGGARFTLDGREYRLPANDGRNTLHGGPNGFAYRVWQAEPDGETLRLTLHSPDGDQGFPGALDVAVEYRLDGNALVIDYAATTNSPTALNLTNHAYFNLSGEASVLEHTLCIPSSRITALNAELIPTGEIRDVAGTPLDFRTPTAIGARIDQPNDQLKYGGGYDLDYVLADAPRATPTLAATLSAGGLVMTMLTTEPGLQFYSGNFLSGAPFARRGAVCLQGQHYTDSLNHPTFPRHRAEARRAVRVAHLVSLRRRLSWRKPLVAFASRGTWVGLRQTLEAGRGLRAKVGMIEGRARPRQRSARLGEPSAFRQRKIRRAVRDGVAGRVCRRLLRRLPTPRLPLPPEQSRDPSDGHSPSHAQYASEDTRHGSAAPPIPV